MSKSAKNVGVTSTAGSSSLIQPPGLHSLYANTHHLSTEHVEECKSFTQMGAANVPKSSILGFERSSVQHECVKTGWMYHPLTNFLERAGF